MSPPRDLDFWPFDLEVGVGVACDLGYPCAKFRLPRPFGFRVRADVRDIRRTTDADDRLMPPPSPTGRGHKNVRDRRRYTGKLFQARGPAAYLQTIPRPIYIVHARVAAP